MAPPSDRPCPKVPHTFITSVPTTLATPAARHHQPNRPCHIPILRIPPLPPGPHPHRYIWESKADGAFAISEDNEGEPLGRGTQINIYLKVCVGAGMCVRVCLCLNVSRSTS